MTKLSRSYVWYGIGATLVQYGIPLSYVIYRYDIFRTQDNPYQLTGWGIIAIAIIGLLFRNKIKTFIQDYNTHLSKTAQRGKWGVTFLSVAGILALASLWIDGALWFFVVTGSSNLVSLSLYKPYDVRHKDYLDMKDLQHKKTLSAKAGV
jgi:hypothetical protein